MVDGLLLIGFFAFIGFFVIYHGWKKNRGIDLLNMEPLVASVIACPPEKIYLGIEVNSEKRCKE